MRVELKSQRLPKRESIDALVCYGRLIDVMDEKKATSIQVLLDTGSPVTYALTSRPEALAGAIPIGPREGKDVIRNVSGVEIEAEGVILSLEISDDLRQSIVFRHVPVYFPKLLHAAAAAEVEAQERSGSRAQLLLGLDTLLAGRCAVALDFAKGQYTVEAP